MPALRGDRASRACDSCRKLKTRCYASKDKKGTCLRCETLGSHCSLAVSRSVEQPTRGLQNVQNNFHDEYRDQDAPIEQRWLPLIDLVWEIETDNDRLSRLESTLDAFISRIDSRLDTLLGSSDTGQIPDAPNSPETTSSTPTQNEAPMLLIRNAAADIGIGSPGQTVTYDPATDIISRGIIAIQDVYDLLCL